jgi:SAM-dependent methyltransferase
MEGEGSMETAFLTKLILWLFLLVFAGSLALLLVILMSLAMGGAPFAATPQRVRKKMLELAEVRQGERVYDLGCGDGMLLIEANRLHGARSRGIELCPPVYWLARLRVWLSGADVEVVRQNFLDADFSDADVVFCYLFPGHMKRLEKALRGLKSGARIITHQFEIPGWAPAAHTEVEGRSSVAKVLKYQV